MRPQSIVNFERLYILAIILGIIGTVVGWDKSVSTMAAAHMSSNILLIGTIISVIIGLLLLYFIARKASPVAKWILVILFLLGLIGFLTQLGTIFESGLAGIIQVVQIILQAIAVYLLFTPASRAWFAEGRGGEDVNEI